MENKDWPLDPSLLDHIIPIKDVKAKKTFDQEFGTHDEDVLGALFKEPLIDAERLQRDYYIDLLARPTLIRHSHNEAIAGHFCDETEQYKLEFRGVEHKLERIIFALYHGFDPMDNVVVFLNGDDRNYHPVNLALRVETTEGKRDHIEGYIETLEKTGFLPLDVELLNKRFKFSRRSPTGLSFKKGNFVDTWMPCIGWVVSPYTLEQEILGYEAEELLQQQMAAKRSGEEDHKLISTVRPRSVIELVSRVVWTLKTGEDPKHLHIAHKDGNLRNVAFENLELTDQPYARPKELRGILLTH